MDLVWVVVIVAICVGVFLLLREFWSWYSKINEIIENQRQTIDLLTQISKGMFRITENGSGASSQGMVARDALRAVAVSQAQRVELVNGRKICPKCKEENREYATTCISCGASL